MQVSGINKGTYTHNYQSTLSLLVIDCVYLEGKDGQIVANELAAFDSHSNRVSSYVFKRPYSLEELSLFNVRINAAIDHGCNWNYGYVPYSELETATSRSIICCCNLLLRACKNIIY